MASIIVQAITIEDLLKQFEIIVERKIHEAISKLQKPEPFTYMTITEVSTLLKVSKVTIHHWKKEGLLKYYRIGRKVFFRSDEIQKSMELKIQSRSFKR